jgi:hypothetical protein
VIFACFGSRALAYYQSALREIAGGLEKGIDG